MKHLLLTIVFFLLNSNLYAQPVLKPSIGIASLPSDSDTICSFTPYLGDFDTSGYNIGDTIPDFTLYTLSGTPVNIQTVLGQGKPVLLISGSLTCPVFREKLPDINNMYNLYAGQLEIFIIYGMEAHPTDPSPYSGAVWITNKNQQEGILYPQPITYGERKALADTLHTLGSISPDILIDGACNEWLMNFGPAPNNAYLIDTTGIIYEKQGWYHKIPDDMYCEIDSLIGTNSGMCNAAGNNGTFSFAYPGDTIDYGTTGDVLAVHATLSNNSSTDNVVIDIIRWQVNVPIGWTTAMCLDVCLPPHVDTTQLTIIPGATQDFTFYFYTDPIQNGIGHAYIGFKNTNIPQNKFFRKFWGETSKVTSSDKTDIDHESINFYPNPSEGIFFLHCSNSFEGSIIVLNTNGEIVKDSGYTSWSEGSELNLTGLPAALYIIQIKKDNELINRKILLR